MIFGPEERAKYDSQKKCFTCGEEFTFGHEKGLKVRDHCHFTGKFRGVLHNVCNLRAKRVWRIPIFFHNLSSFDSHLFVKELSDNGNTNVNAIPENEQRYVSFQKDKYFKVAKMGGGEFVRAVSLVFVDSVRHLQSSLDKLVSYLPKSEFNNMSKCFNEEQLTLLTRKGIFPYEYLDGFERFAEGKLPSMEKFNSRLGCGGVYESEEGDIREIRGNCVSKEDYDYACQVFEKMNCKNLGDNTKLYCLTDSLLLADVFETYRKLCMSTYGLDAAHYLTSPSMGQVAMLKVTKAEIDLLHDQDMHLFFEEGIRGGVSVISNRYAKANNKYMGEE